jgi:ABC-type antimicrobial peptide transport system permease subunit
MIRNYLLVALRNFTRQQFYSFINVIGLATGLACALFIYLWVHDEVNMNSFHERIDRLYQVVLNIKRPDQVITWDNTPGPLSEEIKTNFEEVTHITQVYNEGEHLFQVDEKGFMENGYYSNSEFFKVFTFPIVSGDAENPIRDKRSVAISETLAQKLFGNDDAIGKTVTVRKQYEQKVTAVFANPPKSSTLQFDFILPFDIHRDERGENFNWNNADYWLYLTLAEQGDINAFREKVNVQLDKVTASEEGSDYMDLYVQPFSKRYLRSNFENGVPAGGRMEYVKIFSIVAVFILIIACINFMNMATAKAATRAREVGVRKVVGAQRRSLIFQFMMEAMLFSAVAMLVAFGVVYTLLPLFNLLVSKNIVLDFSDGMIWLTAFGIVFITGIIAGSYPALVLSSYRPASVLKGNLSTTFSGMNLRRALVIFQFTLTVVLIASAIVVHNQMQFIQQKNLGYNRESVIMFAARGATNRDFETFRNEILKNATVTNMGKANGSFIQIQNQTSSVNWSGKPEGESPYFRAVVVDFDVLQTLNFTLKSGRLFSREFNDTSNFVLTQRAVEQMGLTEPVGQRISLWGTEGTVVGVVDDFHSRSMHEAIDPIVFMCNPQWGGLVYARVDPAQAQAAIEHIQSMYKKFSPEYPFEYTFMDESFGKLYKTEQVTGTLALGFTAMAIIISALGLLGLAAYTAERRKKEISIRKTLGASVSGLVTLITRDFVVLSLIAAVVGCPIAWWLMKGFLNNYAYRTVLGWEVFIFTAIGVMALSLLIVIYQVAKAAMANPVNSLRNE